MKKQLSNTVHHIQPYKENGIWFFDDSRLNIKHEPFVGETNTVIDALLAHKGIKGKKFSLMFSSSFLPESDASFKLDAVGPMGDNAWYFDKRLGVRFWLCAVLSKYFKTIPEEIHVKVSAVAV